MCIVVCCSLLVDIHVQSSISFHFDCIPIMIAAMMSVDSLHHNKTHTLMYMQINTCRYSYGTVEPIQKPMEYKQ